VFLFVCLFGFVCGEEYYVSNDGDDGNSGLDLRAISVDSLVAHYRLSQDNYDLANETFSDLSGNGNDCEVYGDSVEFANGHLGQNNFAMIFDGVSNYLNCGSGDEFNINLSGFTFSAWVKNDVLWRDHKPEDDQYLFSRYQDSSNRFYARIRLSDVTQFYSQTLANYLGWSSYHFDIERYNYNLVTMVFDPENNLARVYKNDNLIVEEGFSYDLIENSGDFLIGGYNLVGVWDGAIEEVFVYNRPLGKGEVADLWNEEVPSVMYDGFEDGKSSLWDDDVSGAGGVETALEKYAGDYSCSFTCDSNNYRAERALEKYYHEPNTHWWYRWKIFIEPGFDDSEETWNCLSQLKEWGVPSNPAVALEYLDGKMELVVHFWDDNNNQEMYELVSSAIDVNEGEWIDVVIHPPLPKMLPNQPKNNSHQQTLQNHHCPYILNTLQTHHHNQNQKHSSQQQSHS